MTTGEVASPPTYSLEVSRGCVRLVREGRRVKRPRIATRFVRVADDWVEADPDEIDPWILDDIRQDILTEEEERAEVERWMDPPDPQLQELMDEIRHRRRGDRGLSSRSRMNMRRLFVSLPWELVGARPALISLTYPGVWQPWVINGRQWEVHRRAFERRWVRRWKESLVGVWVKEFQTSGRPHLHLYVGLPSTMSEEDFARLRERTVQRHRLQRQYGKFQGRRHTPPLSLGPYKSEFADWLLEAWSEIVGTDREDTWKRQFDPKGSEYHRTRGADVAVMFWTDEAEAGTDRTRVAQYLASEAGKFAQKRPPPGFERVGRYFGIWGRTVGFRPETTVTPLDADVAAEVEARLVRWVRWKLRVLRSGAPPTTPPMTHFPGDGVTAFGLGTEQAARLIAWSEKAAARRQPKAPQRGRGGAAASDLIELLRSVDLTTGEIPPPGQAKETEPA